MRILAVDDDHFIRELLPLVFAEAGIPSIDIAASGSEALEMIREAPKLYEFLLLDIMMPEMDGIELCQRVRRIPGYRDTPILMLTAKTDIASIEQAFAAGANDYVTKPFDVKEIANRVHVAQRLFLSAQAAPLLDPHGVTEAAPQVPDFALEDSVRLAHTRTHGAALLAGQLPVTAGAEPPGRTGGLCRADRSRGAVLRQLHQP